jgi:hypothetical protein
LRAQIGTFKFKTERTANQGFDETFATDLTMQRRSSKRIQAALAKRSAEPKLEREDSGSESELTELEDEQLDLPHPPKKRRRKTKVTEPVVYDIPPVESKMTTFRGIVFEIPYHVVLPEANLNSDTRSLLRLASRSVGLRESPCSCGVWPLILNS